MYVWAIVEGVSGLLRYRLCYCCVTFLCLVQTLMRKEKYCNTTLLGETLLLKGCPSAAIVLLSSYGRWSILLAKRACKDYFPACLFERFCLMCLWPLWIAHDQLLCSAKTSNACRTVCSATSHLYTALTYVCLSSSVTLQCPGQ